MTTCVAEIPLGSQLGYRNELSCIRLKASLKEGGCSLPVTLCAETECGTVKIRPRPNQTQQRGIDNIHQGIYAANSTFRTVGKSETMRRKRSGNRIDAPTK